MPGVIRTSDPWARVSEVITELVPARPLIPGPLEAAKRGEKVQDQPLLQNRILSQIKIINVCRCGSVVEPLGPRFCLYQGWEAEVAESQSDQNLSHVTFGSHRVIGIWDQMY